MCHVASFTLQLAPLLGYEKWETQIESVLVHVIVTEAGPFGIGTLQLGLFKPAPELAPGQRSLPPDTPHAVRVGDVLGEQLAIEMLHVPDLAVLHQIGEQSGALALLLAECPKHSSYLSIINIFSPAPPPIAHWYSGCV